MSGPGRVLLVEDSEYDAELVLHALAKAGLAVELVLTQDGAEALDYLHERGRFAHRGGGMPVVVLLDIKLPKIDGLEVLQQMRNHEALRRLPVVMLTSSREDRDVTRSYDLGANAYVVKPVDFGDFMQAIRASVAFWATVNQPPPVDS